LSGVLAGFVLANSETVLFQGNAAGIAVSLCIVAVWCLLRDKFALLGVCCLAASLALKPHDAGLVWLYFVLAGGGYRKRALQTLAATAVLGLASVLWVSQVSPDWMREMNSNIAAISQRGQVNDPGPASDTPLMTNAAVNAQTVFSVFWDNPRFYSTASYLLCGGLILIWAFAALRLPFSQTNAWLALAAIAALAMLPVYHRHHDAKLLLLTIPACVIVWTKGRWMGRLGLIITLAALAATGDVPRAILSSIVERMHLSTTSLSGKFLTVAVARPAPLALLAVTVFYLWVLVRVAPAWASRTEPGAPSGFNKEETDRLTA
jgi:hypothetical protein